MADRELREALEALTTTFGEDAIWPEIDQALAMAERMDEAVDDEAVRQLILRLEEYLEARERGAQRLAMAIRVIRQLAEIVLAVAR